MRADHIRKFYVGAMTLMIVSTLIRFVALSKGNIEWTNFMAKVLIASILLFAFAAFLDWDHRSNKPR